MKISPSFCANADLKPSLNKDCGAVKNNMPAAVHSQNCQTSLNSSPSAVYNRSLVSFKGIPVEPKFELSEYDKNFIDAATTSLRLKPEEKEIFIETTKQYIKENKLNSLMDITGDDCVNQQGKYIDLLDKKLELSDNSLLTLSVLLMAVESEDDMLIERMKYSQDIPVIDSILSENNVSARASEFVCEILTKSAIVMELDSIFDFFDENKFENGAARVLSALRNVPGLGTDKAIDVIAQFQKVAQTPVENREEEDKYKNFNNFNSDLKNINLASNIMLNLGLEDSNIRYILGLLKENKVIDNSKKGDCGTFSDSSCTKISFTLAEKYNLSTEQQKALYDLVKKSNDADIAESEEFIKNNFLNGGKAE